MNRIDQDLNTDLHKPFVYHTNSKSAAWTEPTERRVFYQLFRHLVNS